MFKPLFWKRAVERAVKSSAQAFVLLAGADVGFNLLEVNATETAGLMAGAFVLSIFTSLISAPAGPPDDPSVV